MTIVLDGGCRVVHPREVKPLGHGTLQAWPLFGTATGAPALSLRLLEFGPGSSPTYRTPDCDDVWFVLRGAGTLILNGRRHGIEARTGVYVAPGSLVSVHNPTADALVVASARSPDPGHPDSLGQAGVPRDAHAAPGKTSAPLPVVRLAERPEHRLGDRTARLLVDATLGCTRLTSFVAQVPPGRAPDRRSEREEVLCVLEGQGTMWAGRSHAPIGPRSCIYLPPGQLHVIENTGAEPLEVLAVLHPAGDRGASSDA